MKKTIYSLLIIALCIPVFHSCKKSEKQLIRKANELAYAVLQDDSIDSVSILKVEKVTAMRYANIVFEMMEEMENQYRILHEEALFNGEEERAEVLQEEWNKVLAIKEFCFTGIISDAFDDKKIILYMVQYLFFEPDYAESGYFFMTPKFALHELDPFRNNMLK